MEERPLVSVRVATYNHERWLAQCLESILMQRTTFHYEIVVGEDCSTDGTRAIAADYARRFPDRIRVLLHETNLGPQRNSYRIQQACRGRYHAMIEGDDYWIDPMKLQKQVNFMEAHPHVSLCFHNALILNERLNAVRLYFEAPFKEILEFDDMAAQSLPTASILARAEILATLPEWRLTIWCGDLLFRLWCLHHGPFGYLDQLMSVYRRHSGGLEVGRRRRGPQAYFDHVLFTLQEFDQATGFAHSATIRREVARMTRDRSSQKLGILFAFLHPGHLVMRLKEYARVIRQKREFFS